MCQVIRVFDEPEVVDVEERARVLFSASFSYVG
ncbi:hypothetical protein BKA25_004622 [Actinoalloteichus hymeniacidonis]|nr:hypothetical protein [Actinoalloteichus hymeniacidonis]